MTLKPFPKEAKQLPTWLLSRIIHTPTHKGPRGGSYHPRSLTKGPGRPVYPIGPGGPRSASYRSEETSGLRRGSWGSSGGPQTHPPTPTLLLRPKPLSLPWSPWLLQPTLLAPSQHPSIPHSTPPPHCWDPLRCSSPVPAAKSPGPEPPVLPPRGPCHLHCCQTGTEGQEEKVQVHTQEIHGTSAVRCFLPVGISAPYPKS